MAAEISNLTCFPNALSDTHRAIVADAVARRHARKAWDEGRATTTITANRPSINNLRRSSFRLHRNIFNRSHTHNSHLNSGISNPRNSQRRRNPRNPKTPTYSKHYTNLAMC